MQSKGSSVVRVAVGWTLAIALGLASFAWVPAPAFAATEVMKFRATGRGADAFWTSCPAGPIAGGAVCTDTFVYVSEEMSRWDGTQFSGTTLSFYEYSYKVDRKGNYIFVSDRSGYGAATLEIDQKLTRASASASVPLYTCTVDRRGNWKCEEGGTAFVSASWMGEGDLVRTHSHGHTVSKGFTYNNQFRGSYRSATATGQVNGSDLGASFYGTLFNSRSSDIYISR